MAHIDGQFISRCTFRGESQNLMNSYSNSGNSRRDNSWRQTLMIQDRNDHERLKSQWITEVQDRCQSSTWWCAPDVSLLQLIGDEPWHLRAWDVWRPVGSSTCSPALAIHTVVHAGHSIPPISVRRHCYAWIHGTWACKRDYSYLCFASLCLWHGVNKRSVQRM